MVFNAGVVAGFPLSPPVQLYVAAPLAVSEATWPLQILGLLTVTVGFGFTVTVADAVPVHPFVVPVTVYVVVEFNDGVVAGLPLNPPVQLYVVAPFAVNEVVWPSQILGLLTVTVGEGFIIITTVLLVAGLPEIQTAALVITTLT